MRYYKYLNFFFLLGLLSLLLVGCSAGAPELRPVEEEQIENVVKEFMVREGSVPDYEVNIQQATQSWARVAIEPVGIETEPVLLYLQKQVGGTAAPTADPQEQAGTDARVETPTGWTIILGPQAEFSQSELDEAGVPESVRP
jgi:hypothetical protein